MMERRTMEDVPLLQTTSAFAAVRTMDAAASSMDGGLDPASVDIESRPVMGFCIAAAFGLVCWIMLARAIF